MNDDDREREQILDLYQELRRCKKFISLKADLIAILMNMTLLYE